MRKKSGFLLGFGLIGDDGPRRETFDAEFRTAPPVYDKGISKTALICDRDNVQPDGQGGSVAVDTPVCDRQYGLRTNGGYTNELTYRNDFSNAIWQKLGSSFVTGTNTLNFPVANEFIVQPGASAVTAGDVFTGGVKLSGTGTARIRLSRSGAGVYESSEKIITLSSTPTLHTVTHTFANNQDFARLDVGRGAAETAEQIIAEDAQLTKTAYPMPFADADDQSSPVTVGTNYSYDDAGTQKGPHFKFKDSGQVIPAMQWFWEILDGKRQSNLVDIATMTVGTGASRTIADGVATVTGTINWSGLFVDLSSIVAVGDRVEVDYDYKVTTGMFYAHFGTGAIATLFPGGKAATSWTHIQESGVVMADNNRLFRIASNIAFEVEIKNLTFKIISAAQGVIEDPVGWTPGFSADDVPDPSYSCIVAVNNAATAHVLYCRKVSGALSISCFDWVTRVELMTAWQAGVTYPWKIVFGTHHTLGANKMQIQARVNGVWLASPIADFAGTWSPGNYLSYGYSNIYPQHSAGLKARGYVKPEDWKEPT